jgi:hypothetical protein
LKELYGEDLIDLLDVRNNLFKFKRYLSGQPLQRDVTPEEEVRLFFESIRKK